MAIDAELVVIAGIPAPEVTKMESYGGERQVAITLSHLAPYGSPHEAADRVMALVGHEIVTIRDRYPAKLTLE